MAEPEFKVALADPLQGQAPPDAKMIERRKVPLDKKVDYVLARIMVAAIAAELKVLAGGTAIGFVGRSNRYGDLRAVTSTLTAMDEISSTLADADLCLSQFEDMGLEPNPTRHMYCVALNSLLDSLNAALLG